MAADEETSLATEKERLRAQYDRLGRESPPTPNPSSSAEIPTTAPSGNLPGAGNSYRVQPCLDLPPYSGPSSTSYLDLALPAHQQQQQQQQPHPPQEYPGLPRLDYRLYSPPLFELSSDCTTIKSTAPYLSSTVEALTALVRAQSTVPPKPQIHITGKRGGKVDFAIKLNLLPLLVPEVTLGSQQQLQQGPVSYIRCVGSGEVALRGGTRPELLPNLGDEAGLEQWARRFVNDPNQVKAFVLERVVTNLDTNWLSSQIRILVNSLNYKGVVTVSFPVSHSKVVVQSPDRVNKFFTGITTLFAGKRTYEVVKAVWPFATRERTEPSAAADGAPRRCMVQSEDQWWREWAQPIRYAIATKRHGWVTNEDKLEAIMEGKGKGLSAVDWSEEFDGKV
ncbi:hypothetical protein diail_11420 [Diaporthe ilicicola]|nr:hypothetical protein diail_11420 [Diaporthe ilicicola]